MWNRLMMLGGMLVMLLVAAVPAVPAFAQEGSITATGVLGEPYTEGEDPTVQYSFIDEVTGKDYVLISGFVDLGPFVGERITIEAVPVGTAPGVTPSLNVTDVESESGYDPAPLAVITGEIEALAEPILEGGTHTVTEASTGDVYMLWSDPQNGGVDLSQYEGQSAAVYGVFQTQGAPISSFEDPTDVLIAVTSVKSLEPLPVEPPAKSPETTLSFELTVDGTPPAGATFWGQYLVEGATTPLEDQDGDGIYTGSMSGGRPVKGAGFRIVQGTGTEKLMTGLYPGDPITVIKDFGTPAIEGDTVFSASVSFDASSSGDQYNTDNSAKDVDVLPDTGGLSVIALGLISVLLIGGLLTYRFAR